MTKNQLKIGMIIYFVILICILSFPPFFKYVNRAELNMFGLPCLEIFILSSTLLQVIGYTIFYMMEKKIDKHKNK